MSLAAKEILFQAIRDRGIVRKEQQRLISPRGGNNAWLIDMRRILMDATLLDAVADIFWDEVGSKLPFQVGGMEVAAIPLVSAILMKSIARGTPINGFIIRKERKTYGTGSLTEGIISDAPIIIVDDILNSGQSFEKVRVVLEQLNRSIDLAFVLIDYKSKRSHLWRSTHKIRVTATFSLDDFGLNVNKTEPATVRSPFRNVWRFSSPDPNFFHCVPKSFPVTDGKHLYFGSDCGLFWCLRAANGSVAWKFKVHTTGHKNIWSTPAIYEGKVYFGAYDGNVYCLNAGDGTEVWRFVGAEWIGSSPALATNLGLLFIGLEFSNYGKKGSIVALDMDTGEKVWEHITRRYTHASPAYWAQPSLVACGSNDNEMFLFDAKTGHLRWRFETRGEGRKGSIRHAPAFDMKRGSVVTGCADGYIYIIDVETGKEVWSIRTENTIYTVPLVLDDLAFIGSADKHFYILDLENRNIAKKIFVGSKVFGPPCFLRGKIYFGACNGIIYEVDPTSLHVTGMHQLPDAVTNAITYSEDTNCFYALTYVNQLYALAIDQPS